MFFFNNVHTVGFCIIILCIFEANPVPVKFVLYQFFVLLSISYYLYLTCPVLEYRAIQKIAVLTKKQREYNYFQKLINKNANVPTDRFFVRVDFNFSDSNVFLSIGELKKYIRLSSNFFPFHAHQKRNSIPFSLPAARPPANLLKKRLQ